jgi:serine acetyltransferase
MQASLFDDPIAEDRKLKSRLAQANLTGRQKLLLLALNLIPLAHVATLVFIVAWVSSNWIARAFTGIGVLYLLPPALAFFARKSIALRQGRIAYGSRSFFAWWTLLQLQMIFNRLPVLEELLRLVPGVYSAWLRLWGAKIGRLTFWSPGTMILDRSFIQVGDDAILGAGVRINPHVLVKNSSGNSELLLGAVKIGDGARVGGYSLLTAGAEIAAGEVTDALLVLPPFSSFKDGKRIRPKEAV